MKKIDNRISAVIGLFILAILFLMYLFPMVHDDLLHGSAGLSFNFMTSVNGRYLGNLFAINLAASLWLRVIIKTIIIILITLITKKMLKIKNNSHLLIFITLFWFMPIDMFREVFPFTAGFANYVIPIAGILFIIHIHLNNLEFNNKTYLIFLFLILGVFNSLFVEHLTIFNLFLSIYFCIYAYLKKKQINWIYWAYFVGSLIGTLLMFINPTYLVAINGEETYRSFSTIKELFVKPWAILRAAIFKNYAINFMLIFYVAVLYKRKIKKKTLFLRLSMLATILFGIYTLSKIFIPEWPILVSLMKPFEAIITLGFFVCIGYLLFMSKLLKKQETYRIVFYVACIIMILAPLIIVNPIGPRCYILVYFLMIILIIDLFMIMEKNKLVDLDSIVGFLIYIILIQTVIYIVIYGNIYFKNKERLNLINEQLKNKEEIIIVKSLPYSNYIHMANDCTEYGEIVFRNYFNIPSDVLIKRDC